MKPTPAPTRPAARGPWLAPLAALAAVLAALAFVRGGPTWIFGWVFGAGACAMLGWIGVSVLWPASADRTCPKCGRRSVERADPASARGLACRSCGWGEPDASGWLLAEEEGPLERMVLEARARRRVPVDSAEQAGDTLGAPRGQREA